MVMGSPIPRNCSRAPRASSPLVTTPGCGTNTDSASASASIPSTSCALNRSAQAVCSSWASLTGVIMSPLPGESFSMSIVSLSGCPRNRKTIGRTLLSIFGRVRRRSLRGITLSETTFAWQDTSLSARERAKKLVEAMTLEQKIAQLHGAMETIDIYAITREATEAGADMDQLAAQIRIERHVKAIDELGIPRFRITNGPVGVGMGDGTPSPPATSLPMTIGLAAGFDPDLAESYGDIIGSETATLGQHVLEGPGVCLHRTTIAGRNFEYFSEDPYLTGVLAVAVAKAIQAHDVIAMAKHYVVNDQEYEGFGPASRWTSTSCGCSTCCRSRCSSRTPTSPRS